MRRRAARGPRPGAGPASAAAAGRGRSRRSATGARCGPASCEHGHDADRTGLAFGDRRPARWTPVCRRHMVSCGAGRGLVVRAAGRRVGAVGRAGASSATAAAARPPKPARVTSALSAGEHVITRPRPCRPSAAMSRRAATASSSVAAASRATTTSPAVSAASAPQLGPAARTRALHDHVPVVGLPELPGAAPPRRRARTRPGRPLGRARLRRADTHEHCGMAGPGQRTRERAATSGARPPPADAVNEHDRWPRGARARPLTAAWSAASSITAPSTAPVVRRRRRRFQSPAARRSAAARPRGSGRRRPARAASAGRARPPTSTATSSDASSASSALRTGCGAYGEAVASPPARAAGRSRPSHR